MNIEQVSFRNKQGEKLSGILQGDGAKCVILCHGFTGNKSGSRLIAGELEKAGFLVLRFDFSGCGESEGKFEESHYSKKAADLLSAIDFMKRRGCISIGLYGHSMGGAAVILAAAKTKVNAIAETAGTAKPDPERMARFAREWVNKELPKEFLDDVASTDVIQAVKRINAPLLIMHGDKDDIVDIDESKKLYKHAREPKKFLVITGAGHGLETVEQVVKEIVAWMKLHLF